MFWQRETLPIDQPEPSATRLTTSADTASNRVQLAHALLCDGQYDAALAELEVALADNPESADGQLVKGLALARKGEFRAAIRPLRTAIEFGSDQRIASFSLAAAYLRLDEFVNALLLADEMLARDPQDAQACCLSGEALSRLGRTAEALAAFQRGKELDDNLPTAHLRLGELLSQQEDWTRACQALSRAVELSPMDMRSRQALAEAQRRAGRIAEAVNTCREAVQCGVPNPELLLTMAECCLDKGELFDAMAAVRMAMLLNPHSIEAQRLMSRVLSAHGRGPEAEQYAAAADRLAAANEANNGRSTTSTRSEPRPS
jgi:tetratricopeptide (TPR) repeat protein